MKLRIGLNLLTYGVPNFSGGAEVYILNIINSAILQLDQNHELYIYSDVSICKKIRTKNNVYCHPLNNVNISRRFRVIYEQLFFPFLLRKDKIDILISNYVTPLLCSCKSISIIHDMQFKRMPELFESAKLIYWNLFIPLTIWKSKYILTVSEFSKNEIIKYFPKTNNKIYITSEGIKPTILEYSRVFKNKTKHKENFILSVGTFGKHKNLITLIKSMKTIVKTNPEIKLKLVGAARTPDAIKSKENLEKEINYFGLSHVVEFLGFVSDEDLAKLYSKCKAYVFPSLYEGFGLPLIEAQSCGAPVICSNAGALPEIGGDSCIFFNPLDENELAEKIIDLFNNEEKQNNIIEKGYKNIAKYSWEKGAKDLLNVIEELNNSES